MPEVPPVIVSPAVNVPPTLDVTTNPWAALPPEVYAVTFWLVVPSEPNNEKVFTPGFLTVNTVVAVATAESIVKPVVPEIVTCWPSLNLWPVHVTILGFATVIPVIATVSTFVIDSTVAVAPEVLPVTFSPVVNACAVWIFKCVNKLMSNK